MTNLKTYFKELFEADNFKARSKESGKLVQFKSKDAYNAALKAGTHEDPKAPKSGKAGGKDSKKDAPKVNIFDKPSKSEPTEKPKAEEPKTAVDDVVYNKRTKTIGIVRMPDERGETKTDADGNVNTDELEPYNPMKYPHQKDAKAAPSTKKEIESRKLFNPFSTKYDRYDTKVEPKTAVDDVVYNTRTKTVGIVRMADERGETKTDADGNVNTSELEPYNPMKYPHQKDAKAAPSTSKEIDSRGLWKPFAGDGNEEPKSEPKKAEEPKKEKVYIDFLNKEKGFRQDRIKFNSYEKAVKWARKNFEKFNPDMIKFESVNETQYPTDLKVGSVILGQGFTRLKGVDGGKYYKIVDMDDTTATLVPSDKSGNVKGSSKVRHKLDSIEGGIKTAKRGDENGIVIIKESVNETQYPTDLKVGSVILGMRETSLKSVFKETKYYKSNSKVIKEAFNVNRDLPTWLFDDPVDFEGWYDGGMKLDKGKGKLAPFSSSDEEKLIQLVGIWQDAEGDYKFGRPGARSDSYSAQNAIKKLLFLKGKVDKTEVVTEGQLSNTWQKNNKKGYVLKVGNIQLKSAGPGGVHDIFVNRQPWGTFHFDYQSGETDYWVQPLKGDDFYVQEIDDIVKRVKASK